MYVVHVATSVCNVKVQSVVTREAWRAFQITSKTLKGRYRHISVRLSWLYENHLTPNFAAQLWDERGESGTST